MKIANYKTAKVGWVIDYNESKIDAKTASRIGGNVAGKKETLERIFNHFAFQRETAGLKNRFIHLKLSLSPSDVNISSNIFRKITERVLSEGLGLNNNPYVIYRHYDTDHPHIHVVVSRVTFDGILVRDSFDGLKLKRLEQKLDKDFELTSSFDRLLSHKGVRTQQKWEKERSERTGIKSVRNYIQFAVIESLHNKPSLTVFVKRLERRGVKIWHRKIHRGLKTHHGLSYSLDPGLINVHFSEKSTNALVAGVTEKDLAILSKTNSSKIEHIFFGPILARLVLNSRGIPELCLNETKPDDHLKPYSFRAGNLGPFFQYPSILSQLSEIEQDTLNYITLMSSKRITHEDYKRKPLTENENSLSKLILAAEIRSEERVIEALREGLNLSQLESMDRVCTEEEKKFIKFAIANEKYQKIDENITTLAIEKLSKLTLQFTSLTQNSPHSETLRAIRLISEQKWTVLQEMLVEAMRNGSRKKAPDPVIMFLKIPTTLSLAMMDYQHWYQNENVELVEDPQSALRHMINRDTEALIVALKNFDEEKVRDILTRGMPDVKLIPLEHLGKVTDPTLSEILYDQSVRHKETESVTDSQRKQQNAVEKQDEKKLTNEKGYEIN